MYTKRILIAAIAASSAVSGNASPLRKLEDEAITIGESQVDSFFDSMKDMIKELLGMGAEEVVEEEPVPETLPETEPPVKEEDEVNPCEGKKPRTVEYFDNQACMIDGVVAVLEQAGANVTEGYTGDLDTGDRVPITTSYAEAGLCPVNVHWHYGTEHLSEGEYDEGGHGPSDDHHERKLAGDVRLGFQCHYYDESDPKFTTEYEWEYCKNMKVGSTYEVHWPHSAAGACGTKWQYQYPFYDGVFCTDGVLSLDPLNTYFKIGVQAQVFTIVNDEAYYNPNMIEGMIIEDDFGADITAYTGSTTGTTRDNEICSKYTPITWQVDRKCHLISASSFDKMCADMLQMADDMSGDVYPHGARELVDDSLAANNQVEGP